MSIEYDTEMSRLQADVAAQNSVIASATAAFRGLSAQILSAEAAAKTAGASDTQLASVVALRQSLESNTAMLASAIPANTDPAAALSTPAAPVVATPVVTTPVVPTPVAADPAAAVPVITDPVVTDPVVTVPAVTELVVANTAAATDSTSAPITPPAPSAIGETASIQP